MEVGKGSADNVTADGFVEFLSSGQRATGEYHCAECGYGVTIFAVLPLCPMCGGARLGAVHLEPVLAGSGYETDAWSPPRAAIALQARRAARLRSRR